MEERGGIFECWKKARRRKRLNLLKAPKKVE
jgi:hypothetical protein